MKSRELAFFVDPTRAEEAKGVDILRSVGNDRMIYLDPILLVDHLHLKHVPHVGKLGFPRHPHRGIETFTIVLKGTMHHKDSLGSESAIGKGGIQWMRAGKGIWHEEMMESNGEGVEVLQLWFNMPRAAKHSAPSYQGYEANSIQVKNGVRVLAGSWGGLVGPADSISVQPTVLHLSLSSGEESRFEVPEDATVAAYLLEGTGAVNSNEVSGPGLAVLTAGTEVVLRADSNSAEWVVIVAPKLNEPVVQFRSFVMNTVEEMGETVRAVQSGTFAS